MGKDYEITLKRARAKRRMKRKKIAAKAAKRK